MNCYVDSSVILRYLLTSSTEFERVKEFEHVGSSELLFIECNRVIQRYRLEAMISDEQLEEIVTYFNQLYERLHIFDMNPGVKRRASEAFPTVIGTLDALHLATASAWAGLDSEPLVVFTFDRQMRRCAQSMGLHAI